MQRFNCECGNTLFFGSAKCLRCGHDVGFDPGSRKLQRLPQTGKGPWKRCDNGTRHGVCNWLLPAASPETLCASCRLNRTVPDLNLGRNQLL